MNFSIDYSLFRKPRIIALITAMLVLLYNAISYFHPSNNHWLDNGLFSITNLISFIFIDQFLIELLTIGILLFLIRKFGEFAKLTSVKADFSSIAKYLVTFLPIILSSFIVFNPITQSIRYFINNYNQLSFDLYLNDYFYSIKLYLVYLPAILLAGYCVLVINLLLCFKKHIPQNDNKESFLLVSDVWGSKPLPYQDINYIEKIGRYYFVFTRDAKFKINLNLIELEKKLSLDFVRINRSVIVNTNQVNNYTYWENDKYLLRLINGKEFVMPRLRLKKIKNQLNL